MKKGWYLSKPVLLSAAGKGADELYRNVLSGRQEYFSRNRKGYHVARYLATGDDTLACLINDTIDALREDAGHVLSKVPPERVGVVVGSCDYFSQKAVEYHRMFVETGTFGDYDISFQSPCKAMEIIKEGLGFKGPAFSVATACASGSTAIARAIDLLDSGASDVVLAGGLDTSSDIIVDGFASLSAVSPDYTNPFSRNRKGITLGDGAGFFFLSRERLFDFPVLITGFAETSDGYNMTAPDPEAKAVMRCLGKALAMASLQPSDIGYINLHGTGTKANDSMEALAVKTVFPGKVRVSSTKPVTGHTLAAAGAIEMGLCAMVLAEGGALPPHIYDGEAEESSLSFVSPGEKEEVKAALSSSFAFGGADAVIILERADA